MAEYHFIKLFIMLLFVATWHFPPVHASSLADSSVLLLAESKEEGKKFSQVLQGLIHDAEPLLDGKLGHQVEEIITSLSSIEMRINTQLEILEKKRERLSTLGLDEADRKDLQTALQVQRAPLERVLESNQKMLAMVKTFQDHTMKEWSIVYSSFRDIVGRDGAREKLSEKVTAYRFELSVEYEEDVVLVEGGALPNDSELAGTTVASFYIGRTEVTWREWKKVRNWAAGHGYDIQNAGQGSGNDHPVRDVSWYDVVKWCNAKSEMEGLTPVYKSGDSIFRSSQRLQVVRDPNPRKDVANVFWSPRYTLFDLFTDEPIFPEIVNGAPIYKIYYSSNENRRPFYAEIPETQLPGFLFYKFKNLKNCQDWCDGKAPPPTPKFEAIACDWSSNGYRLPTEFEWEWAARGGVSSQEYVYSGSNTIDDVGWYFVNSVGAEFNLDDGRGTWPVGIKLSNELGIYDLTGNVWEWCWDTSDSGRRMRGGSWSNFPDNATLAYREIGYNPVNRGHNIGFRLARNAGE